MGVLPLPQHVLVLMPLLVAVVLRSVVIVVVYSKELLRTRPHIQYRGLFPPMAVLLLVLVLG